MQFDKVSSLNSLSEFWDFGITSGLALRFGPCVLALHQEGMHV